MKGEGLEAPDRAADASGADVLRLEAESVIMEAERHAEREGMRHFKCA